MVPTKRWSLAVSVHYCQDELVAYYDSITNKTELHNNALIAYSFIYLITTKTQLNNETRRSVVAEVASRRPIRAVKKARQGCGHDVHNRRSGQGWPVCRLHRTDDQVEEQQLESARFSDSISLVIPRS